MLKRFFGNLLQRKAASIGSVPLSAVIGWVLSHWLGVDPTASTTLAASLASVITTVVHLFYPQSQTAGASSNAKKT